MDFGMPTLIETATIEECVALCSELKLQFIELNMNLPQYQPECMDGKRLRQLAEQNAIYYTIHLDENFNACDYNKRIAKAYTDTALQTIRFAKELKMPVINLHLARGIYITLPDKKRYLFAENEPLFLQALREFRDRATEEIGDSKIKLCVENSSGYNQEFLIHGLDVLLESPAFALTFDIGHDHALGGIDRPVILERGTRLQHMHMHDASGTKNHLTLGTGDIDLKGCLELAKDHNCRVVLETKTIAALRQSVEWLRKYNRKVLQGNETKESEQSKQLR